MRKLTINCIVLFATFFSFGQDNTFPSSFEIIGNYYANNYSVFYPIGFSKSGQLAYIIQDVNSLSAAEIYIYDLYITSDQGWDNVYQESTIYNLEVDTTYNSYHQEFSDYYDTTHFNYTFFTNIYWSTHATQLQDLLKRYNIQRNTTPVVQPISALQKYGVELVIEKHTDTINAIRVDQEFKVSLQTGDFSEKVFSKKNYIDENGWAIDYWGNRVDLMHYKVEGFIRSPFTDDCFLYIHEVTMGFEEPAEKVYLVHFNWPL